MNWKTIIAAGAILLSGTIYAKTPDGETPANESVCDLESGAAYGLCVSYCEAMDCDNEQASSSETACLSVRDKFVQLVGRDLPCEAVECPCFNAFQIGTFFPQITNDPTPDYGIEEGEFHCVIGACNDCIGLIIPTADPFGNTCSVSTSAEWENESFRIEPRIDITAEEAQSCFDILVNHCQ